MIVINSKVFLICKVSQEKCEKSKGKINKIKRSQERKEWKKESCNHMDLSFSYHFLLSFTFSLSPFSSSSPFLRFSLFSLCPPPWLRIRYFSCKKYNPFSLVVMLIVCWVRKLSDPKMGELKMYLGVLLLLWGWN